MVSSFHMRHACVSGGGGIVVIGNGDEGKLRLDGCVVYLKCTSLAPALQIGMQMIGVRD